MNWLKSKDMRLVGLFFDHIKPYWKWIAISLAAIPFATGATILIPWLIVVIIDDYLINADLAGLNMMILAIFLAVVGGLISDAVYTFSLQKAGQSAVSSLRNKLFLHCLTLPRRYFDKNPIGVTLSRLTSDMEAIGESMAIGVLALFTDLIKTVGLMVFLFYLSWKLTLLVLVTFPIILFVVTFLRKKLRYYYNESRETLAKATAYLQECLNGMKTVQLFAAEKRTLDQFKKKNHAFFRAQTRSNFYDASLYSIIEGLTTITMVLMIWYGTGQIFDGIITIGVLIGFINTLSRIFIPIREFAQQIALIQRALSALEHVDKLFDEKPELDEAPLAGAKDLDSSDFNSLVFNKVGFRYTKESPEVLKEVSFSLLKGQRIAIVGTTGSGKSTILKIITKAYDGYNGSIKINGLELSRIPKVELKRMITIMQQDVFLFNESVLFNIGLGRDEITQEKAEEAARFVYAHDFINALPGGYEYKIVDNGQNLSAGQAQLISFARAIAGKSELIVLDEATSSVDSITESLIQKAIEKIFKEKTVIAIAHRLSTIRKSDLILVMKNGQIVEIGNHSDLLAKSGYYVQLLDQLQQDQETKTA